MTATATRPALPPLVGVKVSEGIMPATLTYSERWWLLIDTCQCPGMTVDGFILLGQIVEKSGERQEDTYAITEIRNNIGFGWRSFALRKLGTTPGAEDECYTTSIGPRSSICTCKAGRCKNEVCRHRNGLEHAIKAGAIPPKPQFGS